MSAHENCPRCGDDGISLVDPTEEVWQLDPDDYYEDDPRVWLCVVCGFSEEATEDEIVDEAIANMEWIAERLAAGGGSTP